MATLQKTDIELLHDIKDRDNSEARGVLWKRYQHKIYSHYFAHQKFYSLANVPVDEFVQETYFFFDKAIKAINFDKMEKSGSKSFGTTFYWYLMKAKFHYVKEFEVQGNQLYLSEIFYGQDWENSKNSPMKRKFNEATSTKFEDEVNDKTGHEVINNYIETQDEKGKVIIQLYLESKRIADISRSVNMKYHEVYKYINKAKKEISTIYKQQTII